jgi:4-hydroxybenzoate polyprenyltransferase
LRAALRIFYEVIAYRVRKREMANLAAAAAIMTALRLPARELVVRFAFGVLLNVLAYLTNDYCDIEVDLASPDKDHEKASFLSAHRREALFLQVGIAAVLFVWGLYWDLSLLLSLAFGAGICWVYSAWFKRVALLDIVSMAFWGMAMPLCAVPMHQSVGWLLLVQLGLFSTCFETMQVVRDRRADAAIGLRSTAVVIGERASLVLARVLMAASGIYAILVLDRYVGMIVFGAAFLPLSERNAERSWDHVRWVFGVAWLGLIASIVVRSSTFGWIVRDTVLR